MQTLILCAVLCAAFLHAFWNFLVKKNEDKALAVIAVCLGHLPFALVAMMFSGLPPASSYSYVLLSAFLHTAYQVFLIHAYRFGELSAVYPIARGLSPLLLMIAGFVLGQDILSPYQIMAVCLIGLSLLIFGFSQYQLSKKGVKGVLLAVATGFFIASYSLVDGLGTRDAQNAVAFYAALALVNSLFMTAYFLIWHRSSLWALPTKGQRIFWIGGGASYLAYLTVLWACLHAPIAVVSSIRETSTLIAVLLGVFLLKEKMTWGKASAVCLILTGVLLIRLG